MVRTPIASSDVFFSQIVRMYTYTVPTLPLPINSYIFYRRTLKNCTLFKHFASSSGPPGPPVGGLRLLARHPFGKFLDPSIQTPSTVKSWVRLRYIKQTVEVI